MKICLAASGGGHLTQLLHLSEGWRGRDCFFVTAGALVPEPLRSQVKTYTVPKANRQHPLQLLRMFLQCMRILRTERPDVVISTGAAAGCILCLLAKLMRKKVVWIDSIANVERLSLSGRIIRPFADLFLVQWPELAKRYKGVRYDGSVI
jgi:UDP-N-acetylglucosamine:LPS N-acetylglucosamine transferase